MYKGKGKENTRRRQTIGACSWCLLYSYLGGWRWLADLLCVESRPSIWRLPTRRWLRCASSAAWTINVVSRVSVATWKEIIVPDTVRSPVTLYYCNQNRMRIIQQINAHFRHWFVSYNYMASIHLFCLYKTSMFDI